MVTASPKRHNRATAQPQVSPPAASGKRKGPAGKRRRARAPTAISASMRVTDITALCPDAESVFAEYGIHCAGCSIGGMETLEEGCRIHGLEDGDIRDLVEDLNVLLRGLPKRPATLVVTAAAARAIRKVMEAEGRTEEGLLVTADGSGGFCLEFRKEPAPGTRVFFHEEAPDVRVFASPLTLKRLGGSTIDYREDRFKLDLPEDDCAGDGSCGKECGCSGKGERKEKKER